MSDIRDVAAAVAGDFGDDDFDGIDDDFAPIDIGAAVTAALVRGESRSQIASDLQIPLAEVNARVAEAARASADEAVDEREFVVRERLRSVTRQASTIGLPEDETTRLSLLLSLCELEITFLTWARQQIAETRH